MPLIKSASPQAFKQNVKAEIGAGKPRAQALAIAYNTQRHPYAMGGLTQPLRMGPGQMNLPRMRLPEVGSSPHIGPITGFTGGRADARKMQVAAGSYVIPAAVVSHLGEGNTLAGNRVLNTMFSSGPYGTALSKLPVRSTIPKAHLASGGLSPQNAPAVPIFAADGEFVLSPDQVAALGGGDMKKGHDILDHFVRQQLQEAAKTLKKLPGPRKR